MKAPNILTAAAFLVVAGASAGQTPVNNWNAKAKEVTPIPLLVVDSVSSTDAAHPGNMVMTGTGMLFVEHVFYAGKEAQILERTATTLTFLPQAGDPGLWPLAVATATQRVEKQVPFLPYLDAMPQDAVWYEWDPGRSWPTDAACGMHLTTGYHGPYLLWVGDEMRTTPLPFDRYEFDFWLAEPYEVFGAGMVPDSGSVVVQYRLPAYMRGQELYIQGLVMHSPDCFSFTNVDEMEIY
jgi:hypothetical protein